MRRFLRTLAAGGAAAALAGAGFWAGCTASRDHEIVARATQVAPAPEPAEALAAAPQTPRSFAQLVRTAAPAVVHVKVTSVVKTAGPGGVPGFPGLPPELFGENGAFGPFAGPRGRRAPQEFRREGAGSGFVIREDGVILTNDHVVEDAKEIRVTFADGRELPATVLGRDPKTDLAVLKVEATGLPVARLGDSDRIGVGDWVVAIGNPFGLDNTVTAGIVSAKGRAIGSGPYDDFIQTDAPINPGNSGGPLLDDQGNVVGINAAIFSQGGGSIGIGFAIPINLAKRLVPELEATGHVTRAWLGVTIQKLTPELAESLGLESGQGALVAAVSTKSPAAGAGIAAGDVITEWNGKPVKDQSALPTLVAETAVGATVPVQIVRDGKARRLEVTVTRMADEEVALDGPAPTKGRWGLALRELEPADRERRGLAAGEGVLIAGVVPDSPAADAGIQAGDVVLAIERTPVGSVEAARRAVEGAAQAKRLLLLVRPATGAARFTALAAR